RRRNPARGSGRRPRQRRLADEHVELGPIAARQPNDAGSELDMLVIERALRIHPQKMRDLADKRMREARSAAAVLGVPTRRQYFLGYPDGGLLTLITDPFTTPYYSKFTGAVSVPYSDTAAAGHPYTGESLERDFGRVLDRVRPTLVLAPSPQDAHPDHRAAGIVTLQVLSRRR